MKKALHLAIWVTVLAAPASAQEIATSFDELQGRIKMGQTLFITDTRGTTIEGRLLTLSASSLDVQLGRNEAAPHVRLTEADVNNVYIVRRDRWWNSPLIGFAIGAGIAAVVEAINSRGSQKFQGGSLVGLGNLCALVGFTFDVLNKDKVTVYVQKPESRN